MTFMISYNKYILILIIDTKNKEKSELYRDIPTNLSLSLPTSIQTYMSEFLFKRTVFTPNLHDMTWNPPFVGTLKSQPLKPCPGWQNL